MKDRINYSQKLNISHRKPFFNLSLNKNNFSSDNEKQIMSNHKYSLETLLATIKHSQIEFLSKESQKSKSKNKKTKQMLKLLKETMNLMLKEKNKKLNYLKNQNEISKKKKQKLLFPISKDLKQIENNKIYFPILEINQLQILNFQIQNEIEKTNYLIELKLNIITYINEMKFFFDINQEIFCNNNYNTIIKITGILNEKIREIRK